MTIRTLSALAILVLFAAPLSAQRPSPRDTEVWTPVPTVITPGPYTAGAPPSDAIVLFGGANLDEWVNRDGSPAGWTVADGVMTVNKSAGDISTRRSFRDFQLHIEWRIPANISGEAQERGNSGLFLAQTERGGYELQILDSWQNETYVNGMAGSIYKQAMPLVNPMRPPGEWQTFDVIWTAPRFAEDGTLVSPARLTAFFNDVLIQNDFELTGFTVHVGQPRYRAHGEAPILLQAHQDPSPPISFRNIWVRPLS